MDFDNKSLARQPLSSDGPTAEIHPNLVLRYLNLIIASIWSIVFILIFYVATLIAIKNNEITQLIEMTYLWVPILLAWATFFAWKNPSSKIKIANLVFAIIYTVLFGVIIIKGWLGGSIAY